MSYSMSSRSSPGSGGASTSSRSRDPAGRSASGCLRRDQLGGARSDLDEHLVARRRRSRSRPPRWPTGRITACSELGHAGDVVDDADDGVRPVADEDRRLVVDAGDAELVGGDPAEHATRSARLSANSSKRRPVRRWGARRAGPPGSRPSRGSTAAAATGWRAGGRRGPSSSTAQNSPACSTPLSRSSRCCASAGNGWSTSVGLVAEGRRLGRVDDAHLGGSESVEALAHLGLGRGCEPGGGHEGPDADDGAERGEQRPSRPAGDRGRRFADQVAERQRRAQPSRSIRPSHAAVTASTTPLWTTPSRISTMRWARWPTSWSWVITTTVSPSWCSSSISVEHLLAGRGVEVAGRLVAQHEGRPAHQGPGQRDPLTLATGHLRRGGPHPLGRARPVRARRSPGAGAPCAATFWYSRPVSTFSTAVR